MTLRETELSETIYILLDDGDVVGWSDDLGAARMLQAQDDLELTRFRYAPMSAKAWEGIDREKYQTLDQLKEA